METLQERFARDPVAHQISALQFDPMTRRSLLMQHAVAYYCVECVYTFSHALWRAARTLLQPANLLPR